MPSEKDGPEYTNPSRPCPRCGKVCWPLKGGKMPTHKDPRGFAYCSPPVPVDMVPRRIAAERERIAEEMRQMVADAEHWNRTHPDEEPIVIDTDLGPEINALLASKGLQPSLSIEVRHVQPATNECANCGHQHAGADYAGICIGCPCPGFRPNIKIVEADEAESLQPPPSGGG